MDHPSKTYSELIKFKTYEERFKYLVLNGEAFEETFGSRRYINQQFYTSPMWREIRRKVILRDNGCDLGLDGYDIYGDIYVHHMNPISIPDVVNLTPYACDPEYLICVSYNTHLALHYGGEKMVQFAVTERHENDTCPWKK